METMANPNPSPETRWSEDRQPTVYNGGRPKGWTKQQQIILDELDVPITARDAKGETRKMLLARMAVHKLKEGMGSKAIDWRMLIAILELISKNAGKEQSSNVNVNLRKLPTIPVDLKEFFMSKGMPEKGAVEMMKALLEVLYPEGEELD